MKNCIMLYILLITSPALAGTLVDNFDDGNFDGWEMHNVGGIAFDDSSWEVQDGVLIAERHNAWALQLTVGEKDWADYAVECDIQLIELFPNDLKNNGAGIILRRLDNDNVLGFDSLMLPTPSIWGWIWKDRTFVHDTTKAFPLNLNQWYRFRVQASGNDLSFFVNEELAMEIQNTWLQQGLVGINIAGARAQYDNFSVTGKNIPDTNMSLALEPNDKLTTTWGQIRRRI